LFASRKDQPVPLRHRRRGQDCLPPAGTSSSPSSLDGRPDHRNSRKSRSISSPCTRRAGRGTKERGTPVPPENGDRVSVGLIPRSRRRSVKSPKVKGKPIDPSPQPQPQAAEAIAFPVCTIVGVVEFGRKGKEPTRLSRLVGLSGIPSPAAGFRRRALFQEAASRQLRASRTPSATTTACLGPFGPTAPPHILEGSSKRATAVTLPTGLADTRSQPLVLESSVLSNKGRGRVGRNDRLDLNLGP